MYDGDRDVVLVKGDEIKLFAVLLFGIRLRFLTVQAYLVDPLVFLKML